MLMTTTFNFFKKRKKLKTHKRENIYPFICLYQIIVVPLH